MNRFIAFCAATLAALAVALFVVQMGSVVTPVTKAQAAGTKVCKSRMPTGKLKTWRCSTDQACCVNHDMGLYVCGFPGLGCL